MKFCYKCGKELVDEAVVCIACGTAQRTPSKVAASDDSKSFGWAFLGFWVPIVGLILYLIWQDNYPLRAKSAGKGALIGFIGSVIYSILYIIMLAFAVGSSFYYYM